MMTGDPEQADTVVDHALAHAPIPFVRAEWLGIQIMLNTIYVTTSRRKSTAYLLEAYRHVFAQLGIRMPQHPNAWTVRRTRWTLQWRLRRLLRGRPRAPLLTRAPMTDPTLIRVVQMCYDLTLALDWTTYGNLQEWVIEKGVQLTLRHGITTTGLQLLSAYGALLAGRGEVQTGQALLQWVLDHCRQTQDQNAHCTALFVMGLFIHPWTQHWRTLTADFLQAIEVGQQFFALNHSWSSVNHCYVWNPTLDLDTMVNKQQAVIKNTSIPDIYSTGKRVFYFWQWMKNLQGTTEGRLSLTDAQFNETAYTPSLKEWGSANWIWGYHFIKHDLSVCYGDYATALEHLKTLDQLPSPIMHSPRQVRVCLNTFLTLAPLYPGMPPHEQRTTQRRLKKEAAQMRRWASLCPVNFLHLQFLMEAELARLFGKPLQAEPLYYQAIATAKANEFRRDEALANELAAKFHLGRGFPDAAEGYMRQAYYLYYRWGATRKLEHLEETYPQLLGEQEMRRGTSQPGARQETSSSSDSTEDSMSSSTLDLTTVLKSCQALSREMNMPKMLSQLLRIMIENAGAHRGVLLLQQDGQWIVEAEGRAVAEDDVLFPQTPLTDYAPLSEAIVRYVARTHEPVLLHEATQEGAYIQDPYVLVHQPKSILCLPILHQAHLTGILYLENNLTVGAFTPDRVELLQALAAQAAISIENVRLVATLEQRVQERTQALVEAKIQADQANQAKSMFLANMSHELRTPLHSILGFAQLVSRTATLTAQEQENLGTINRAGEHLLGLINDVLEVAKIEAGKLALTLAPCALQTLLTDLESLFRDRAAAKGLAWAVTFPPTLPQTIQTDANKLREILINLIGNAIKFTETGHVTVRVWSERATPTEGDAPPLQLHCEVADTGPGIAEAELPHVFGVFDQTSSGQQTTGGTGLGMAITKAYVELFGGQITVESQVGQGTVFHVRLPVQAEEAEPALGALADVAHLAPAHTGRYRLFVVDDVAENRQLLRQLLEAVGFLTQEAASGREALDLVQTWHPHLVLLDLKMPEMDGLEVTRALRAREASRQLPIIIVSADVLGGQAQRVQEAGANGFLPKPIQEPALWQCLQEQLGVTYVYAGAEEAPAKPAVPALTRAAVEQLAPDIRAQLRQSVQLGDLTEFARLLDGLNEQEGALVVNLRALGEHLHLEKLLDMLAD